MMYFVVGPGLVDPMPRVYLGESLIAVAGMVLSLSATLEDQQG